MQFFLGRETEGAPGGGREKNMSPWSGEGGVCNFFFHNTQQYGVSGIYWPVSWIFPWAGGAVVARSTCNRKAVGSIPAQVILVLVEGPLWAHDAASRLGRKTPKSSVSAEISLGWTREPRLGADCGPGGRVLERGSSRNRRPVGKTKWFWSLYKRRKSLQPKTRFLLVFSILKCRNI